MSHWTVSSKTLGRSCSRTTASIFRRTSGSVVGFNDATMSFHWLNRSGERSSNRCRYWLAASRHKLSQSTELQRSIAYRNDRTKMTLLRSWIPPNVPTLVNQSAFSNCSSVAAVCGCILSLMVVVAEAFRECWEREQIRESRKLPVAERLVRPSQQRRRETVHPLLMPAATPVRIERWSGSNHEAVRLRKAIQRVRKRSSRPRECSSNCRCQESRCCDGPTASSA